MKMQKTILSTLTLSIIVSGTFFYLQNSETEHVSHISVNVQQTQHNFGLVTGADPIHYTKEEELERATVLEKEAQRKANRRNVGHVTALDYAERSEFGERPAKLKGVELQRLYYDNNGNFILTNNLKQLVEHFMLATDAEGLDQSLLRLYEYIGMVLPPEATDQANEVVNNYLAYKDSVNEVPDISDVYGTDTSALIDKMEVTLDMRKKLRREHLGDATTSAFYGDQEQYDAYTIQRAKISTNEDLGYWEKDAALAQAEKALPSKSYKRVKYKREEKNLEKNVAALRNEGADNAKIHAELVAFYGEETAERISYFDNKTDEWNIRVATWEAEKFIVDNDSTLSQEEKQGMVGSLIGSHFSEREQSKLTLHALKDQLAVVMQNRPQQ
jgi:lipase chaperone LimK